MYPTPPMALIPPIANDSHYQLAIYNLDLQDISVTSLQQYSDIYSTINISIIPFLQSPIIPILQPLLAQSLVAKATPI